MPWSSTFTHSDWSEVSPDTQPGPNRGLPVAGAAVGSRLLNVRDTDRPPPKEATAASLPEMARLPVCRLAVPTPTSALAYISP